MKQYVEEQVTVGDYSSASEYMRELVRADQKRNAKEQLEQTLLESLLGRRGAGGHSGILEHAPR